MADRVIYVSRLVRLPVLGTDGIEVARIVDVVLGASARGEAPRVDGYVVTGQRARVFISAGRIAEISGDGARLRYGSINMHHFELRPGERLAVGEIFGRRVNGKRVVDLGIRPVANVPYAWEVATVALGTAFQIAARRAPQVVDWDEQRDLFTEEQAEVRQAAAIGMLHPAEMAEAIRNLPLERRRVLAGVLEEERLADLLEELPEDEQVRIVQGLDLQRAARVLDEMQADDAADLLGELPQGQRDAILRAMAPDEAEPVRRLLNYEADTAGGLMTPEPVIMAANATVADALARVRDPDLPVALAAQVFVTAPPLQTPTGRFMGVAHIQRLLREVPTKPLGRCLDEQMEPVSPEAPDYQVAALLAAYNAVAVPVVDEAGRFVGAVSIDDVLDHVLPDNWRMR